MPTCYQAAADASIVKTGNVPWLQRVKISQKNVPVQEGINNSPRYQRAPLCHPAYGPWLWHVVRGAWPAVCARGPTYWCQESLGLQDVGLLQRPLALALAPPWCTALVTAQPAQRPRQKSEENMYMQSSIFICIQMNTSEQLPQKYWSNM